MKFSDSETYIYTYASTGKKHIEDMKKLAVQGYGLTTYINKNVRQAYARKLVVR